jgi:hypothetical protein
MGAAASAQRTQPPSFAPLTILMTPIEQIHPIFHIAGDGPLGCYAKLSNGRWDRLFECA